MLDCMSKSRMKHLIRFGVNIKSSIKRIILFTVMNLYVVVKIFVMEIVICGIKYTPYHPQKSFVLYRVGYLRQFLEYNMQSVHGVMLKQSSQTKYQLW